jgi:ABC-type amino acid transport system permease subunit
MSSIEIGLIAFACLFGGSLVGMGLRRALPQHHMSDDSQHLLGLGLGIIGTMAGLVLGLLVGSATASYNAQRNELLDVASKVILLDRVLEHYGPDATPARRALRAMVAHAVNRVWPQSRAAEGGMEALGSGGAGNAFFDTIEDLVPKNDAQRELKPQAIGLVVALGQTRWLMYEQTGSSLSVPLLVLLIFWFTITFIGFGLFAPSNATVIVALALCACAVSGAVFVTVEMYTPFERELMQISSEPLRQALAVMGR